MPDHPEDASATADETDESSGPSADEGPSPSAGPPDGEMDERTRRWLIRLLVGTAIGIPVLIEGSTFVGLLKSHFGGGGSGSPTRTETPGERRVGVGDELLPSTPQREILSDAFVKGPSGDTWRFTAVVTVENTGEDPYEVRLGAVTLDDGRTVDGGGASGQVPPGDTATLRTTWDIPAGSEPTRLDVSGLTYGETTERVRESVRLRSVPIEG